MMHVLVNAHAGDFQTNDDRLRRLRQALRDHGIDAKLITPDDGETLEDCAERLLQNGADPLVAAGGDGTIAALAGPCYRAGTRLGIIPMGTFNYFARAHGISQDLDRAVALLAQQPERDVAPGKVNGRIFLNNLSIGVYPTILQEREDIYARYGRSRAAAYWSVLKALVRRPRSLKLRLDLDGKTQELSTPLAFIAASAYQLDEFGLDDRDALRNGQFPIFIAPQVTRRALLHTAWRLSLGKAVKGPDYRVLTARNIEITPEQSKVLVACDGEKINMDAPLRIHLPDRPLRLIALEQDV